MTSGWETKDRYSYLIFRVNAGHLRNYGILEAIGPVNIDSLLKILHRGPGL